MLPYLLKRPDAFAEGVWRTGRGADASMPLRIAVFLFPAIWRHEPDDGLEGAVSLRACIYWHALSKEARPIPAVPVRSRIPHPHPVGFLPVKEVDNVVRRQAVQVDSEFPASLWSQIHFPFMYSSSALVILAHSVRVILFPCIMCHSCHLEAGFRQGVARARESGCPLSALSAGAAGEAPGRHPK